MTDASQKALERFDEILRELALLRYQELERELGPELTREAVKGMEASKLADRATHGATLPFTRLLAGPAEYTPVIFGERRANTKYSLVETARRP